MSISPGIFEEPPAVSSTEESFSPQKILISLAGMIFLAEMAAMAIIYFLDIQNYLVRSLLDGIIMIALILPGLYALQLNPLLKQMNERSRAEQALRTSDELLKKVLDLLPIGVWITDRGGKIVHGNPASQDIWAGSRYVGMELDHEYKAWWAVIRKRVEPEEWAVSRAILHGETTLNQEIEIECFDGTHKIILNSAVPILDAQDSVRGRDHRQPGYQLEQTSRKRPDPEK